MLCEWLGARNRVAVLVLAGTHHCPRNVKTRGGGRALGQANFGVLVRGLLGQLLPEDVGLERVRSALEMSCPGRKLGAGTTAMPLTSTGGAANRHSISTAAHGLPWGPQGRGGNAALRELAGEARRRFRAGLAGKAVSGALPWANTGMPYHPLPIPAQSHQQVGGKPAQRPSSACPASPGDACQGAGGLRELCFSRR